VQEPAILQTLADYRHALLHLMDRIGSIAADAAPTEFLRQLGALIPEDHRHRNVRGIQKWETILRSARQQLAQAGLMNDYTSGAWAITEDGRRWLREHPDGGQELLHQMLQQRSRENRQQPTSTAPALPSTDSQAHVILDQTIGQIRRFLRGNSTRPSDEVLCDWVQFCYTFELYVEGHKLFALIDPAALDAWPYQRAKKLAQVCRMRSSKK
jgi:hypothetical protein